MQQKMEAEQWSRCGHRQRCKIVAQTRHAIAANAEKLVELCSTDQRPDAVETVTAELLPLCSALAFIGSRGPSVLKSRKAGFWGRPLWLIGVSSKIHRQPLGSVLVLAAWNYPLLLPGVQVAQALAAGNSVLLKPAPGCEAVTQLLVEAFYQAGVPSSVLTLLPSSPQAAQDAIASGVDLVVLTGGTQTGRSVLAQCAQKLNPAIMELSGCDALVVGPGANLQRVAKAIRFGLSINGGATCIGPRRIIVSSSLHQPLVAEIASSIADLPPMPLHRSAQMAASELIHDAIDRGAVDCVSRKKPVLAAKVESIKPTVLDGVASDWPIAQSDLFAPVASLLIAQSDDHMVEIINRCRYRLAAAVFGRGKWASQLAARLDGGHGSINDVIFPTADPRVPFGGCGASGFGVTRGAEGLLAMTRPKVIATHRGPIYVHLMPRKANDFTALMRLLKFLHGYRWRS